MLKISKMSGKLEGIPAINTDTTSNPFCQKMNKSDKKDLICVKCYSFKMLETFRKNCVPVFQENGRILSGAVIPENELPFINSAVFRFSAHGELINETHLVNLMNLVKRNKLTTFTLWTKRKNLVNKYYRKYGKPENVIFIYSNPYINTIAKLPEYFDKTFNNVSEDKPEINCHMKCKDCLLCYTKNDTETIIEKVK